jgi:hypothetical protein
MRFLAWSTALSLDEAASTVLKENWNISNAYLPENGNIEFEIDLTIHESGIDHAFSYRLQISAGRAALTGTQVLQVLRETLVVTSGDLPHVTLIENDKGAAQVLEEKSSLPPRASENPAVEGLIRHRASKHLGMQVPREWTALAKLFDADANRLAVAFKQHLGKCWYYSLNPEAMRSPKATVESPVVMPDGANLGKVLFALHNENPRLERKIIDALKLVEPKVDLLKFYSRDPEFIFVHFEDKHGRPFSVQNMSDGTLRYLVLCFLLAVLDLGGPSKDPGGAPCILFEEPENGLFVGNLKPLFEKLDFNGTNGQCIFTSHSPYFIDLFDAHLESVHLMKPGIPSASLLKPDPARVRQLLNEMPLGELHYREMLG